MPGELLHAAGLRGDEDRVGRVLGVRAARAPRGDPAVDQRRVDRVQRRVVDPQPGNLGSAVRYDDGVGPTDERDEALTVPGVLEVQRHAALAAQPHRGGGVGAARVAAGGLDLDDIGAVVGEHHGGDAAGGSGRKVEDSQVVARAGHGVSFLLRVRESYAHDVNPDLDVRWGFEHALGTVTGRAG